MNSHIRTMLALNTQYAYLYRLLLRCVQWFCTHRLVVKSPHGHKSEHLHSQQHGSHLPRSSQPITFCILYQSEAGSIQVSLPPLPATRTGKFNRRTPPGVARELDIPCATEQLCIYVLRQFRNAVWLKEVALLDIVSWHHCHVQPGLVSPERLVHELPAS